MNISIYSNNSCFVIVPEVFKTKKNVILWQAMFRGKDIENKFKVNNYLVFLV